MSNLVFPNKYWNLIGMFAEESDFYLKKFSTDNDERTRLSVSINTDMFA